MGMSSNLSSHEPAMIRRFFLIVPFILFWIGRVAAAQSEKDSLQFFELKIRPALVEHCYRCHSQSATKLKGNLLLDTKSGWQRGGDSGDPAIVPFDPDASLLIKTIRHLEPGLEMPPEGAKLPESVIADFVTWIKSGAIDPRDEKPAEAKRGDKSWWSLQPIRSPSESMSIDRFVVDRLRTEGLAMNPPADGRTLLRRITYDLHGLPPREEEVALFSSRYDRAVDPTERSSILAEWIDQLLASPRYGERWGRHWLDVVRFGESNGFERNFLIDDLYPFRDYVIRSIQMDKPFNQLIVEHLAGDVIGKGDPSVEVGSAFLVAGPYDDVGNQDPVAAANIRAATLDEMITATSSAFLGMTIHCARCHHHKFDPIPSDDYYRLRAAFEGTTHGRRVVATNEERENHASTLGPLRKELEKLTKQRADLNQSITGRAKQIYESSQWQRPKVDPHGTTEDFEPIEAKHLRFTIQTLTSSDPLKDAKPSQGGKLTEFQVWSAADPQRNVALASFGTIAAGAKSSVAEDFPEAYGPAYCIDGKFGEAWFIGSPPVLTLTFAKRETIHRITFVNARGGRDTDESKVRGGTPCEYTVEVSLDGESWTTVASDEGREPWSESHGIAKARRSTITPEELDQLASLEREIASINKEIAAVPPLREMWVGNHKQPSDKTYVHKGGDPTKPTNQVMASSPSFTGEVISGYEMDADCNEGMRRLALAQWIVRDDNPLTARVLANRVWQYHFGAGIVDTPNDFGFLGSTPSHPELLEYLTNRLIANGWKLKPLHREIMLSDTYRQSSSYSESAFLKDRDSRLLWRFPPRRLAAEEVRDTMLFHAGLLQMEPIGGPGFRLYKHLQNNVSTYVPLDMHGPETFRRSVYHQNARASIVDVLSDFDFPDNAFSAPKRANTITPLQALTMLNHHFIITISDALAARVQVVSKKPEEQIGKLYQIVYQRHPTEEEKTLALQLLANRSLSSLCRAIINSNELVFLD
jgi:hypothetical protein